MVIKHKKLKIGSLVKVYSFWNETLDGKMGIIVQNEVNYCDHPFYELFGDLDLDDVHEACYEVKVDNFIYLFTDYELELISEPSSSNENTKKD